MTLLLGFAFVAGLLTIVGPCTLPVIPLILGGAAGDGQRRIGGIVVGFAATFVLTTVVIAASLAAVGLTTTTLRLAAAVVLGVVGLTLAIPRLGRWAGSRIPGIGTGRPTSFDAAGVADLEIAEPSRRASVTCGGFGRGLAVGAAIGLVWAPCVGPIMAAVIAAAVVSGPSGTSVAIALAYVIGAVLPLAAIARWGRRATRAVDRRGAERARRAFGLAMTMASIIVVTGLDVPLQAGLTAALPAQLSASIFAIEQRPAVEEELHVIRPSDAAAADAEPLEDLGPAPELTGITAWINSPPLTLADLRGKVVLVHFWTFGCINCIHVQPYVKAWSDRYAVDGFVVIGVHTPELSFERDLGNVRAAVAKDGVTFPVAFDPSYATWNAYRNSYWPAFYFVDKVGRIRHAHFGEGDYDGSEAVIRQLLAEPG